MRRLLILAMLMGVVLTALPAQARNQKPEVFVIENGDTTSATVDIADRCIVGLKFPVSFTGTLINAKCSTDNRNFGDLYDSAGVQWVQTFTTIRFIDLTQGNKAICGCRFVQFVSDATELGKREIGTETAR